MGRGSSGTVRMTPADRDFESKLRRALHEAADAVEPAGDALEHIHTRLAQPWLKRQLWLARAAWVNVAWSIRVRIELVGQRMNSARMALVRQIRAGLAALAAEGPLSRVAVTLPQILSMRRRIPAHASRTAPGSGRFPVAIGWMRSVAAVVGAVAIVVAAVYTLGQLRQTVIEISQFTNTSPASASAPASTPTHSRKTSKPAVVTNPSPAASTTQPTSAAPSPSPTCSPSPSSQPSPSASPSPSESATPTPSSSPTPTPTAEASVPAVTRPAPADISTLTTQRCTQPGPTPTSSSLGP